MGSSGLGVVVTLTQQEVQDAQDPDPETFLRNRVRTALINYTGLRPSDDPVAVRVDLDTQQPNMTLGAAAEPTTIYVLGTQALEDGESGFRRQIRLYGWIVGRNGLRYLRRKQGPDDDRTIPTGALRHMDRLTAQFP